MSSPRNLTTTFGFAFEFPTPPTSSDPASAQPPAKRRKTNVAIHDDKTMGTADGSVSDPVHATVVAPLVAPRTVRKSRARSEAVKPATTNDAGDDSFIANLRPKRSRAKPKGEAVIAVQEIGERREQSAPTTDAVVNGKTPRKAAAKRTAKATKTQTKTPGITLEKPAVEARTAEVGAALSFAESLVHSGSGQSNALVQKVAGNDAQPPPIAIGTARPSKNAAADDTVQPSKDPARSGRPPARRVANETTTSRAASRPKSPPSRVVEATITTRVPVNLSEGPAAKGPPRKRKPFSYAEDLDDSLLSHPPTAKKVRPKKRATGPKRTAKPAKAGAGSRDRRPVASPAPDESVGQTRNGAAMPGCGDAATPPSATAGGDAGRGSRRRWPLQEAHSNIVRLLSTSPEKAETKNAASQSVAVADRVAGETASKPNTKRKLDPASLDRHPARLITDDDVADDAFGRRGTKRQRSDDRLDSRVSGAVEAPPKRKRRKFAEVLAEMDLDDLVIRVDEHDSFEPDSTNILVLAMAAPIASILSLPTELITQIYRFAHGHQDRKAYLDIGTSPRKLQPGAEAFSRVCRALRQITLSELEATPFRYISSASGTHSGRIDRNAADDLLSWLHGLPRLAGQQGLRPSSVRKLRLEMYASELLWMFAPAAGASLLGMPMPGDRYMWSEALAGLKELQIDRLEVTILDHTCPHPCDNGFKCGRLHQTPPNPDGSTPRHWIPDHRWIIKAILESGPGVDPSTITFFWLGHEISQPAAAAIAGCSWTMLHSSSEFHKCDALAYEDRRQRFWAIIEGRRECYQTPVTYVDAKRVGRETGTGNYLADHAPLDLSRVLPRLFDEVNAA
ncbi:hypothetical protein LTR53_000793 [Teratosphaeriaceae sp. CCFEE 6253]|nr:hypothetical protein LTR53_000793 [Teratosphaeriaceae sp. CCFEE 6253]